MKHLLFCFPLAAVLAACQQPATPPAPSYEGHYALQLTSDFNYNNTPVSGSRSQTGTLTVVKQADGIYSFTENFPDATINRSYKALVTGGTFTVPILSEPLSVNGVPYDAQYRGSGDFKINSVTITRTTSLTAGSVRVSGKVTTYCYR